MNLERRKKRDAGWFKPIPELSNDINAKKVCLEPKKRAQKNKNVDNINTIDNGNCIGDVFNSNWIEKFSPTDVSELAVNPKKVDEVRSWIQIALKNKICPNSMLLLTGPSGCGKTATVQVLVKAVGAILSEWITPTDTGYYKDKEDFINSNYERQSLKFSNFLLKSSCYPSLLSSSSTPRIVLVEDYPNFLIKDSSEFIEILLKYQSKGKSPLIFICSDNNAGSSNIAWNLFPPSTIEKFNIHQINFNSITATNMRTALKRVTSKMHPSSYNIPNQDCIDGIVNSSMGDVRSAINNLHLTALKGSHHILLQNTASNKNQKKKAKNSKENNKKLDGFGKDENISVMHGVGRVLNPKFIDNKKEFTHPPISIMEQFQSLPNLFVGYINENYLPHFSNIQHVERAARSLSDADCLMNEWKVKDSKHFGLLVAITGVMCANESPVSSWHPIRGQRRAEAQYPKISEFPLLDQNQFISGKTLNADYKTYYNVIKKCNSVLDTNGFDEEMNIDDVF